MLRPIRLNPISAAALVLVGAFSVQYGAAVATLLFPVTGPGTTVLLRVAFAAIVVTLLLRPRWSLIAGLGRRGWLVVFCYGATMAVMNLTFYHALEELPLGTTVTIEFLGPLALALLGSRRALDVVWALMAVVGVALVTGFRIDAYPVLGVALALTAGAAWAFYLVLASKSSALLPAREGLSVGLIAAAVCALPAGVAGLPRAVAHPWALLAGLGVALLSTAIPYGIDLLSLRAVPTGVYGVLMSLEPAVAALSGLLVLGQQLGLVQWFAMLLVVSASAGAAVTAARRPPPAESGPAGG